MPSFEKDRDDKEADFKNVNELLLDGEEEEDEISNDSWGFLLSFVI